MRKAQSATLDLLIGILVIAAGVILIAVFGLPQTQQSPAYTEAQSAAQAIYNPYPRNWTNQTVAIPGFIIDHQINTSLFLRAQTLDEFQSLMSSSSTIFVNTTIGTIDQAPTSDAADIVAVTRYAAYNGNITEIEVIAWTQK